MSKDLAHIYLVTRADSRKPLQGLSINQLVNSLCEGSVLDFSPNGSPTPTVHLWLHDLGESSVTLRSSVKHTRMLVLRGNKDSFFCCSSCQAAPPEGDYNWS